MDNNKIKGIIFMVIGMVLLSYSMTTLFIPLLSIIGGLFMLNQGLKLYNHTSLQGMAARWWFMRSWR